MWSDAKGLTACESGAPDLTMTGRGSACVAGVAGSGSFVRTVRAAFESGPRLLTTTGRESVCVAGVADPGYVL